MACRTHGRGLIYRIGSSIAQAEPEDCSDLITMKSGFSLVEATVLRSGVFKKIYIQYRYSSTIQRGTNTNPFALNGDLIPKQSTPISSDIVSGSIGVNGNTWVTYLQQRNANENTGLCSAFYA